jgi:hypothetical protein
MLDALDALIDQLSKPVSEDEKTSGWTPQTKGDFATWFRRKRELLTRGEWAPDFGLVRSLDMFGISDGTLTEEAICINRALADAIEPAAKQT